MEMKSSEVGKNVHFYFLFFCSRLSHIYRKEKSIDNHLKTIHVLHVTHRQIIQHLLTFFFLLTL